MICYEHSLKAGLLRIGLDCLGWPGCQKCCLPAKSEQELVGFVDLNAFLLHTGYDQLLGLLNAYCLTTKVNLSIDYLPQTASLLAGDSNRVCDAAWMTVLGFAKVLGIEKGLNRPELEVGLTLVVGGLQACDLLAHGSNV